jgi:hypothetical protein
MYIMICVQCSEQTGITVNSNHTDVLVLLLHFYHDVDVEFASQ